VGKCGACYLDEHQRMGARLPVAEHYEQAIDELDTSELLLTTR
jgi:hypothetical protein